MDRFWSKVDVGHPLGCWEWTAAKTANGYGNFGVEGKFRSAHRFAYELLIGPISEGLHLDHLCRVRNCVNPDHLEPVTNLENIYRGYGAARNRLKTHCPKGHEYNEENTYIDPRGWRNCRICKKSSKKRISRQLSTHCFRGHELIVDNLYIYPNGRRECRLCRAIRKRV